MTPFLSFGDRLREARKDLGLTQLELARLIRVHKSEISHYEVKDQVPGFWHLVELAAVLNVSLDWLTCLVNEKRPLRHDSRT